MYRLKLALLEEFREVRLQLFDKNVADLRKKITNNYHPVPVSTIDTLISAFLKDGTTQDECFTLMPKEIEQLKVISESIGSWMPDVKLNYTIKPDISLIGTIEKIRGLEGAETKIGLDYWGINLYDYTIHWKAYCVIFGLNSFTLFAIQYSDYRPFSLKFNHFTFYPSAGLKSEVLMECEHFIQWCGFNKLEKYIV